MFLRSYTFKILDIFKSNNFQNNLNTQIKQFLSYSRKTTRDTALTEIFDVLTQISRVLLMFLGSYTAQIVAIFKTNNFPVQNKYLNPVVFELFQKKIVAYIKLMHDLEVI